MDCQEMARGGSKEAWATRAQQLEATPMIKEAQGELQTKLSNPCPAAARSKPSNPKAKLETKRKTRDG